MSLDDELFRKIDLSLRQAADRARAPLPAAREAAKKRTTDLARRCGAALAKARAALAKARRGRRASQGDLRAAEAEVERHRRAAKALDEEARALREKDRGRRDASKKLARLFARTLAANGELRAELQRALRAAGPKLAESELDLVESRDTVVNLMLQLARERRRWQAALLVMRRRGKASQPSAKEAKKRLDDLELELAESQETAAKLLVELTRKGRRAEAANKLGQRASLRSGAKVPNRGFTVAPAIAVSAARFDEGLRALIESPAMDPDTVSRVARQGMALTRILHLAAEISDGLPAGLEPGGLVRARLERCLDQWEAEAARRRLTIVRRFAKSLPDALVPLGGFESVLDELYGGAISTAPIGTVIVASAEASDDGGLLISIQDAGIEGLKRTPGAIESLALALTRELIERWGGKLVTGASANGRARLATLTLAAKK